MKEIWKDIKGYKGLYKISNHGRIWSISRTDSMGRHKGGISLKLRSYGSYQKVCLNKDGVKITYNVHRLVAEHFVSNPENKPQVNHINGIKTDNRVENLEWVNPKENMNHAKSNGLLHDFKKDTHHSSNLCKQDIINIRNSDKLGVELAKDYNVHPSTIYRIKGKKRWSHI